MAAAALLRSVAKKLARAPPHPRPLLARGLHDGARSGPGGSLPPLTNDQQIQQGRLVTGMAGAAGAGLPSLTTKVARAPPQPHHRLLHERGFHSSRAFPNHPGASAYTPPPPPPRPSNDDLRLKIAMFSTGMDVVAACAFLGITIYFCHRINHPKMPEAEASSRRTSSNRNQDDDLTKKKLGSELERLVAEDDVGIMPSLGHGKQQTNGRARVDKSEADLLALMAVIKDMRAEVRAMEAMIREREAALAELNVALESALGKLEKERCSRVQRG